MTRLFTYRFEDGTEMQTAHMTSNALALCEEHHGPCTYNGWAEFMGVGKPSTIGIIGGANTRGNGFKTGYNPALGIEIKSPRHYRDELKARGFVETGGEKRKETGGVKSKVAEAVVEEAKKQ